MLLILGFCLGLSLVALNAIAKHINRQCDVDDMLGRIDKFCVGGEF
jgi:hypothetical protein